MLISTHYVREQFNVSREKKNENTFVGNFHTVV